MLMKSAVPDLNFIELNPFGIAYFINFIKIWYIFKLQSIYRFNY